MAALDTTDATSQLRRGVLELCILQVLQRDASYGYEIVTHARSAGAAGGGENTVYPLLRRLKTDGLLETFTRESPSGPPRQYYRLTGDGRRRLYALGKEWDTMVAAVDAVAATETTHEPHPLAERYVTQLERELRRPHARRSRRDRAGDPPSHRRCRRRRQADRRRAHRARSGRCAGARLRGRAAAPSEDTEEGFRQACDAPSPSSASSP